MWSISNEKIECYLIKILALTLFSFCKDPARSCLIIYHFSFSTLVSQRNCISITFCARPAFYGAFFSDPKSLTVKNLSQHKICHDQKLPKEIYLLRKMGRHIGHQGRRMGQLFKGPSIKDVGIVLAIFDKYPPPPCRNFYPDLPNFYLLIQEFETLHEVEVKKKLCPC